MKTPRFFFKRNGTPKPTAQGRKSDRLGAKTGKFFPKNTDAGTPVFTGAGLIVSKHKTT